MIVHLKFKMMNQENFDYLKNQVKFTGFGDGLENALKEKINEGQPEFSLQHNAEYGADKVGSTLHFRKSEETDRYYFNRYEMSLNKDGHEVKQTFFVGKDNTFTNKEAYNLLDGRAVNKNLVNRDGENYNSWVKLDLNDAEPNGNFKMKHFHENYGYDVAEALSKHDLKELRDNTDKERLIESLKKGNKQSITYYHEGEERKGFAQANPQYKSVKLLDEKGKEVRSSARQSEKQKEQSSAKQKTKQSTGEDDGKKESDKQSRRRGKRVA